MDDDAGKRAKVERSKLLDCVFGDVLPSVTSDESRASEPDRSSDEWFLENRPPHHDRSD